MKILIVIIVVLSAFIGTGIIRLIIKQLIRKYGILKNLQKLMPLAGLIAWLIILFWAVNYLFNDKSYYYVIIISIIVVLSLTIGWFLLKDIIAGIIFRIQNNYSHGEYVQFGEISGQLDEMLLTHISVHTKDGKSIKIPYSKLSNEIISLKLETKSYENNRFIMDISRKFPREETENIILDLLNKSPWRLGSTLPSIKFLDMDKDHYSIEVQVQVRNQKHLNHIQDNLLKRFS